MQRPRHLRKSFVAIAIVSALVACDDNGEGSGSHRLAGTCGFPSRIIGFEGDPALRPFVLEGAEIASFGGRKKRVNLTLNVPFDVQDALSRYRRASKNAGFEILGVDNEGFEAYLYLRKGSDLAQLRIWRSECRAAVEVYVTIMRSALRTRSG